MSSGDLWVYFTTTQGSIPRGCAMGEGKGWALASCIGEVFRSSAHKEGMLSEELDIGKHNRHWWYWWCTKSWPGGYSTACMYETKTYPLQLQMWCVLFTVCQGEITPGDHSCKGSHKCTQSCSFCIADKSTINPGTKSQQRHLQGP